MTCDDGLFGAGSDVSPSVGLTRGYCFFSHLFFPWMTDDVRVRFFLFQFACESICFRDLY